MYGTFKYHIIPTSPPLFPTATLIQIPTSCAYRQPGGISNRFATPTQLESLTDALQSLAPYLHHIMFMPIGAITLFAQIIIILTHEGAAVEAGAHDGVHFALVARETVMDCVLEGQFLADLR